MRESYIFQPGGQTFLLICLIKVQSFFYFRFFVRFIKVPNFRILQFLKYFFSKQVFFFTEIITYNYNIKNYAIKELGLKYQTLQIKFQ